MEHKYLVFVYGTLMSNYWNNRLLKQSGSTLVARGQTTNSFVMLASGNNGIPFVVDTQPNASRFWLENCTPIKGEVWEVNADALADLDRLEGHPRWYKREEIGIKMNGRLSLDSDVCTAWCYLMPVNDKEMQDRKNFPIVIASGDYTDFV